MQTIHVRYLNKKAPATAIYMANWPNTIGFFDLTRVAFPKPAEKKIVQGEPWEKHRASDIYYC